MLRRALVAILAMSPAGLPAASLAYDIEPKPPESAFAAKLHPDILGISTDATADSARTIFESVFKGRTDTKTDIQRQKFGGTAIRTAQCFRAASRRPRAPTTLTSLPEP